MADQNGSNMMAGQTALALVKSFFEAKERHDIKGTMDVFSDDAVYIFPLTASGKQENWFTYKGKEAITEYQAKTLERFKQIRMIDPRFVVSEDAKAVFVESNGDYVAADEMPYQNVYIFKFVLRSGKVVEVYEYANPVTFAKFANLPIGR